MEVDDVKESKQSPPYSPQSLPTELLPPRKRLEDILCDPSDFEEEKIADTLRDWKNDLKRLRKRKGGFQLNKPSMIVSDWLFLGDTQAAYHLEMLNALGITHILNVTREVTPFHIFHTDPTFKYSQIVIDDAHATESIYDYFEAAKQFIDECNPSVNGGDDGKRILIHCAQGKSRSSSVVIAYLMSSVVAFSEMEMNRIRYIRECLSADTFEHKIKDMMVSFVANTDRLETELDEMQKSELNKIRAEKYNEQCLKLNVAYYFTKSCREVISPNVSFCAQLKRYEMLYQNGIDTLCDLPTFTDWNNDTGPIWREAHDQYPIPFPDVSVVDGAQRGLSCILL